MSSIDCSLGIVSDHTFGADVIDILLPSCLKLFEKTPLGIILLCNLLKNPLVKSGMWENHILDKDHWNIRVCISDDSEEFLTFLIDKIVPCIRSIVKNEESRILHRSHKMCNLHVKQSVSAEAEVEDLAVQAAADDVCVRHTRTVCTATLKDAGTIHHDRLLPRWTVYCRRRKKSTFVNADFQRRHSVIQRKIKHIFTLYRIHILYECPFRLFTLRLSAAHMSPLSIVKCIKV